MRALLVWVRLFWNSGDSPSPRPRCSLRASQAAPSGGTEARAQAHLLFQRSRTLLVIALLVTVTACGDQAVDNGNPTLDAGAGGGSTTVATGGGGAGGAGGATGTGGQPAGLADVELIHGSDTTKVDVAALPTVDYKGSPVVPLTVVWSAGKLTEDIANLAFDFEGDDGFHPSMKGGDCLAYPTATEIEKGYILPDTRTLVWDDALGFPGCFSVKATAKIIGLDQTP